jgi:hypothetical protein
MFFPLNKMDPLVEAVIPVFNFRIELAVTDLPEPLSPTMPNVLPE